MSAVPKAVPASIGATEDTFTDVVETVEEIFSPRPDGIVARHRAERDRKAAIAQENANVQERIEEHSFKAVKVAQVQPETFTVNVLTIPAGGNAMVLPLSPYRYRATIAVSAPAAISIGSPAMPASTIAYQNNSTQAQQVTIAPNGATVNGVTINGLEAENNNQSFLVNPGGSIAVTYTGGTPTWVWTPVGPSGTTASILVSKDNGQAIGGVGFPVSSGSPLTINSRAQLYAFNPSSVPVTVSIIAELNAPEQ
jgi:hypothetical protein